MYDVLHIPAAAVSTVRPDAVEGCKVKITTGVRTVLLTFLIQ